VKLKNILITGSAGYVGSSLYKYLDKKGYNPTGFFHDNRVKGQKYFTGDLMNKDSINNGLKNIEIVVHCAAKVGGGWPKKDYLINFIGTKNVLDCAIEQGTKRIVHISSLAVVDEYIDHYNDTEDIPYATKFKDHYAPSKIEAEKYLLARKDDIEIIILRPGWVWGPGEKSTKEILDMIKMGKFRFIGNGNNLTYFTHIDNLLNAIECSLTIKNFPSGEIFNITDGRKISMNKFVNAIASQLGVKPVNKTVPFWMANIFTFFSEHLIQSSSLTRQNVAIMSNNLHFSIKKARSELGYSPDTELNKKIQEIVEYDF
jgi:dihydroflavonol-4-reductase